MSRSPRALLAPAALTVSLLAACDDPAAPRGPSEVESIRIDTTAISLVRAVTVTMREPGPATLTWGADGTRVLTLRADSTALVHRFLITRLRQGRTYALEARGASASAAPRALSFAVESLPPTLREIRITETGEPTHPVALIEVVGATAFGGLLMVEDGEVVGWLPMNGSLFGATRRANGNIIMLDAALGLVEYRLDGSPVRRLPHPDPAAPTPYGRIHHDVIATPQNTALFIANETQVVGADTVVGEAIWEWTPETGATVRRFSVFDHLDWTVLRGSRTQPGNWLHGNGLGIGPRGNVLMSMRNVDQVLSIAPGWATVEWTIGGTNGTLGISAADRFWGQHYVSEPAPGRVLVFDNGYERPGGTFSRAIEYEVDVANDTVRKVWEYRDVPENYAALVGSARRLANGNTVMMFGMYPGQNGSTGPITAVEVTPAGAPVWRLFFGDQLRRLYRITEVASLLGEEPGAFASR